jgi:hypothetical protein
VGRRGIPDGGTVTYHPWQRNETPRGDCSTQKRAVHHCRGGAEAAGAPLATAAA